MLSAAYYNGFSPLAEGLTVVYSILSAGENASGLPLNTGIRVSYWVPSISGGIISLFWASDALDLGGDGYPGSGIPELFPSSELVGETSF